MINFMSPDADHSPPQFLELRNIALVPLDVPSDLIDPVLRDAVAPPSEVVAVPEVPVDEHRKSPPREHDIGRAWQRLHVLSESQPVSL